MSNISLLALRMVLLFAMFSLAPTNIAFGHARYDRSEPAADSTVEGSPFVLKAWFTQELMSKSSLVVHDETGAQVDLGDGRVDLDDPDRKVMLVSLPALTTGVYRVIWTSLSAEDGDEEIGTFSFGVGVAPSAAATDEYVTGSSSEMFQTFR